MSMKRSKPTSRGRGRDAESESAFPSAKAQERAANWQEDVASKDDAAFVPYGMTVTFQKGALLRHSKFGRGLVTGVEAQRIEVLFEEGLKKLSHAMPE